MTMANSIITYDRDVGPTVESFGPKFPTISQVEYALCILPPKYPVPALVYQDYWYFTEAGLMVYRVIHDYVNMCWTFFADGSMYVDRRGF